MANEFKGRSPYMDYRNSVPFMNLSCYIVEQPTALEEKPAESLIDRLNRKRFSGRVNFRRMQYRVMCEEYRNGRL